MANHLALAALIDPGDEVLIESPTYELVVSTARYLQAKIVRFPRREENGFADRSRGNSQSDHAENEAGLSNESS